MKVAGILRKSPTKKGAVEVSVEIQKQQVKNKIILELGKDIEINWFSDTCKGDDEQGRKQLKKFFRNIKNYSYAYCYNVDRFSRSWLGLKWFHTYFLNGCKLRFVTEVPELYDEDGLINPDSYMVFFIMCGFAEAELMRIRRRTKLGRDRILLNPKLRKQKYKGGKRGRTWKR